ncbi:aldo/keto reductase [bacterium]|nr:aldo/keto reductase [bacterium]
MTTDFREPRVLGRSGLRAGRLGFGSSYGAPVAAYREAFERGANYFYWGSVRRAGMAEAIRQLAPQRRDRLVVVVQSYSRRGTLLRWTVKSALRRLRLEQADVLLLGWHNQFPPERLLAGALRLREQGLVRCLGVSCHHRPLFRRYLADARFDLIMVRYNAAHRGAEQEVFDHLPVDPVARPGVVTYTTTRWGMILDPQFTPARMRTPTATDCYRFALSQPRVDVCLSGPSSLEQMRSNLQVLERGPMNEEELAWMRAVGDAVHRATARRWRNPFMQREP